MTTATDRALRSDAARNRTRVVEVAAELFARRGLDVGIPEIARRAGVGKATVYRSFPSKDELVAAVIERRMRWMLRRTEEAGARADAGAALRDLLFEMAAVQARDLALADAIAIQKRLPELETTLDALRAALDGLIARAREEGAIRADVDGPTVRLHLGAISHALAAVGEHDPEVWRRHIALVADGLAPPARG